MVDFILVDKSTDNPISMHEINRKKFELTD